MSNSFEIIMVESGREENELLKELQEDPRFELIKTTDGKQAAQLLAGKHVDAILIDYDRPDNPSLDALSRTYSFPPQPPVLLRIAPDAKRTSIQEVTAFLVRGPVDAQTINRAVRYAVGRTQVASASKTRPFADLSSGLYNEAGFMALSEQLLKLAKRQTRGTLLYISKIENYKELIGNENTEDVDRVLMSQVAGLFQTSFRESDIIARIKQDEIWVLALEITPEGAEVVTQRFQESLDKYNLHRSHTTLKIKHGMAFFDPSSPQSLQQLIVSAQKAMDPPKGNGQSTPATDTWE